MKNFLNKMPVPLPVLAALVFFTLLGYALFYMGVQVWRANLVDDAFITFRYSQNVAGGHGIVWNIGEERTEGYTSPLQMFLLVPVLWLGIYPLAFMKALGILSVAILIPLILVRQIHHFFPKKGTPLFCLAMLLPGLWLMLHPNVIHALSGMETAIVLLLYTFYGVWIARLVEGSCVGRNIRRWEWGFTLALAFMVMLVRSEAGAIAVGGLAVLTLYSATRKMSIILIGGFFGLLALYLVWKKIYFGYILPNPYYHKVNPHGVMFPGFWDVRAFLNHHLLLVVIPAAAWIVAPPTRKNPFHPLEVYCLGGIFFYTIFFLRVEHIMGFEFRFMWHSTPFFFLLLVCCAWRIQEWLNPNPSERMPQLRSDPLAWLGVAVAFVVLFAGLAIRFPSQSALYALFRTPFSPQPGGQLVRGGYDVHWRVGHALGALDLDYSTTINGSEAGIIPFFAGTRSIDFVGLNDNTITRGTREEREAYIAANPIDVDFSLSTSGSLDDFAPHFHWLQSDSQGVRNHARELFINRAEEFYYAGNFYWWVDERRQHFIWWVRKSHPRAVDITRALRDVADTYEPNNLRYGPYPDDVSSSILPAR